MLNNVTLMGRLTADPEIRHTSNDVAVCNFSLAVQRLRKDKNGEKITDFFSCEIWRNQAELFEKLCHKGGLIVLNGVLHNDRYEDKDGNKRTLTKIIVSNFYLTEKKGAAENGEFDDMFKDVPLNDTSEDYRTDEVDLDDDLPF